MRWTWGAALAASLALAAPVEAVGQAASDRAQVEKLVYDFEAAWNRHDMIAFANLFHPNADWVQWRGGLWSGKQAIHDGHKLLHDTFYSTSHATVEGIEAVDFLAPTVAYVRVRSDMTGDQRSPGQTFRYRRTMLLTKRDGAWRIEKGHNTRIHDDLR